jgi:parvulin-like peptidyl-prolyl isomerase
MKKALPVLAFLALLGAALSAEIIEQVLVKVNGEIVTKTEFERLQVAALRELPNPPDPSRMTDAELSKVLAQVTPQVIVTVVDEMLLLQRAKELGYSVSDAQFNQVLESIKKDNKMRATRRSKQP